MGSRSLVSTNKRESKIFYTNLNERDGKMVGQYQKNVRLQKEYGKMNTTKYYYRSPEKSQEWGDGVK